jgi:hypothetical protein
MPNGLNLRADNQDPRRLEGVSMKRPVSLVASLLLALTTIGGCGAAAAGKPQLTEACNAKMGSVQKCTCFADTLEKGLTPEEFGKIAQAIDDNKRFSELVPGSLLKDAKLSSAITEASLACFN